MLRISEIDGVIRVNGEELGSAAFEIIFREALGLDNYATVCRELEEKGVSYVDLRPGVRGVPLAERMSRGEATLALQAIADSYETVADSVEKLSEVLEALTAPTLMTPLKLIAGKE